MGRWFAVVAAVAAIAWYLGWTYAEQQSAEFDERSRVAAGANLDRAASQEALEPDLDGAFIEEHPFWWSVLLGIGVAIVGVVIVLLASIAVGLNANRAAETPLRGDTRRP